MIVTPTAPVELAVPTPTAGPGTDEQPAQGLPDTPEVPAAATDPEGEPEADSGNAPNVEAKKWRTKLREAEAERDTLSATLEAMQRREVDRLAAQTLSVPGDLLEIGTMPLADLLTDTGEVDPEKVEQATATLLATRPGLRLVRHSRAWGQGSPGPGSTSGTGWQGLLSNT